MLVSIVIVVQKFVLSSIVWKDVCYGECLLRIISVEEALLDYWFDASRKLRVQQQRERGATGPWTRRSSNSLLHKKLVSAFLLKLLPNWLSKSSMNQTES